MAHFQKGALNLKHFTCSLIKLPNKYFELQISFLKAFTHYLTTSIIHPKSMYMFYMY